MTKIHVRANREGLPIGITLTAGETHDSTAYADLMTERDSDPDTLLGTAATTATRSVMTCVPEVARRDIPTKRNRLIKYSVNRPLYAMRNRIERFINRIKNRRRIATRYDHTAISFLGFVLLGCIRLWIRFVHAA